MSESQTLLHSSARANTAAEAKYRVEYPNSQPRASRIIALDEAAAGIMRRVAEAPWQGAHFATYVRKTAPAGFQDLPVDAVLKSPDGAETTLAAELEGADVAVMIATAGEGAEGASVVGNACFVRGIMTAGLIVVEAARRGEVERAVQALRPYASVLVLATTEEYVPEMLGALRA